MEHTPELESIDEEECLQLLGAQSLGRLAVVNDDQPLILPLNYCLQDRQVVFRTASGGNLQRATLSKVAFEVDEYDPASGVGWSVLIQGVLREITDAIDPRSEALRQLKVEPLAPGERERWLTVHPVQITGRRFQGVGG